MLGASRGEGASPPWGLADVAASLVLIVAAAGLLFGGLFLLRPAVSRQAALPFGMVAAFLAEATIFLVVWLFSVRKYRAPWSVLGFRRFDLTRSVVLVATILVMSYSVNILYVQAISALGLESLRPPPILPPSLTGMWRLVIPLALAAGVAPLVEETFFRGFVFAALRKRFGFWLAAVGSATLFTLAHLQVSVLLPVFILGVALAWLFERTRSIWPCIALHLVYNSLALLIAYSFEGSRSSG